ncbi:zinc finger and SCAN domain-containing protein 12-like [Dicentrarchus labrax]|uniref:zinc finger and SCAN domain-containing protein 12-like n=1 Tax=Dicentrarchus labrax TaxID=13489 RepID=UPI0021F628D0|nr:zinc finger and SCAN domain-containing protein 12-like [Dicentrarchus labrax]
MSSVEYLTEFVNERLSAAAEEILRVFKQRIIEYEEEIERQRTLLAIAWKPKVQLHRMELPRQHVCKEEEDLHEQCKMERNSGEAREDSEPPQIKEEQEEICTSQEEEHLAPVQGWGTFMLIPTCEDQTLLLNPDETLGATERETPLNIGQSCVVSESNSDHELLSHDHHATGNEDHTGDTNGNPESSRDAEPNPQKRRLKRSICSNDLCNSTMLKVHLNTHTGKQLSKCDTCGKAFNKMSKLKRHMMIHTGEKPYVCSTCGKAQRCNTNLKIHMRIHTGEKPHVCITCGKGFSQTSDLKRHARTHTGEKPYGCVRCGEHYTWKNQLTKHKESCSLKSI